MGQGAVVSTGLGRRIAGPIDGNRSWCRCSRWHRRSHGLGHRHAHGLQLLIELGAAQALTLQQGATEALITGEGQQQMALIDAGGSLLLAFLLSQIQQQLQVIAHIERVAAAGGLAGAKVFEVVAQLRALQAQGVQQRPQPLLIEQGQHQVLNIHLTVAPAAGFLLGAEQQIPSEIVEAFWLGGEAETGIRQPHRLESSTGSVPPCSHPDPPQRR